MPYTIALLGGIGPISTGYFYKLLVDKLQKSGLIKKNTDFPHILVNSIPAPELTSNQVSDALLEPYIEGLKELASFNPDLVCMINNTIHVFFDKVKEASKLSTLISIRDCVERRMQQHSKSKICILGTPLTVKSGLYEFEDLNYINPSQEELLELGRIVNQYNATGDAATCLPLLENLIKTKQAQGAELFLLACTEVTALVSSLKGLHFEDTLTILAEEVVARWRTNC